MTNEVAIEKRFEIEVRDLEYQRVGGAPLLARLYRPIGKGPFPALIEVHGGAWASGDRLNNAPLDEALAKSGIAVLAIDFRMPPEHRYPASIADVNLATRWLKTHAGEFGSRRELVGGLGTSSGGHQLLLSALKPKDPRYAALSLSEAPAEERHRAGRRGLVGFAEIVETGERFLHFRRTLQIQLRWVLDSIFFRDKPTHADAAQAVVRVVVFLGQKMYVVRADEADA